MVAMAASSSRVRDAAVFVSTADLSAAFGGINFGVISLLVVRIGTLVNRLGIVKPRMKPTKKHGTSRSHSQNRRLGSRRNPQRTRPACGFWLLPDARFL